MQEIDNYLIMFFSLFFCENYQKKGVLVSITLIFYKYFDNNNIRNMAFIIQQPVFQTHLHLFKNPIKQTNQKLDQELNQKSLQTLQSSVEQMFLVFNDQEQSKPKSLHCRVALPGRQQLVFTSDVQNSSNRSGIRGILCNEGGPIGPRSSQISKQLCKMMAHFNNIGRKFNSNFLVKPPYGALYITVPNVIKNYQKPILLFKKIIQDCIIFANNFLPYILYQSNIISFSQLKKSKSQFLYYYLWHNKKSDIFKSAQVSQLLPLFSIPVTYSEPLNNMIEQGNTCQAIINLAYKKRKYQEQALFIQPHQYQGQIPINNKFQPQNIKQMIRHPLLKDQKSTFSEKNNIQSMLRACNTINLSGWTEPTYLAEGGWAKILKIDASFNFVYSVDPVRAKQMEPQEQSQQPEQMVNGSVTKKLVIKIPRQTKDKQRFALMSNKLKYQKLIIMRFRGAQTNSLPKYYHTVQKNFDYRQYFLMDYIQGRSIGQQIAIRSATLSQATKIYWLLNAVNGVKFLQDYQVAHLDLSPNNLIVCRGNLIKLIDFGQAYHPIATKPYLPHLNPKCQYVYSPGRTFPYAPPQTSQRNYDLNSKQDIYSLGVLAFKLLTGYLPFTCSFSQNQKIYREGTYSNRILFAPEQIQDIGTIQTMETIINIVFQMLRVQQKKRPQPVWLHIALNKLLDMMPR